MKKTHEKELGFIYSKPSIIVAYVSSSLMVVMGVYFLMKVEKPDLTFILCALYTLGMGITGVVIATVRANRVKNRNT